MQAHKVGAAAGRLLATRSLPDRRVGIASKPLVAYESVLAGIEPEGLSCGRFAEVGVLPKIALPAHPQSLEDLAGGNIGGVAPGHDAMGMQVLEPVLQDSPARLGGISVAMVEGIENVAELPGRHDPNALALERSSVWAGLARCGHRSWSPQTFLALATTPTLIEGVHEGITRPWEQELWVNERSPCSSL